MKNAVWHSSSTSTDEFEMKQRRWSCNQGTGQARGDQSSSPSCATDFLHKAGHFTEPMKYFLNAQESHEAGFFKHPGWTVGSEEAQLGQQTPIPLGDETTAAGTGGRIPSEEISSRKLNPRCEGNRFQSQSKYKVQEVCLRSWQVWNPSWKDNAANYRKESAWD